MKLLTDSFELFTRNSTGLKGFSTENVLDTLYNI